MNTYLGINAAATALLLGRRATAWRIAETVGQTLQHRQRVLDGRADAAVTYWDCASGAEAYLLQGELTLARRAYAGAFARFPAQRGVQEVTRAQAEELLRAHGLACGFDAWLAQPDATAPVTLTVGITGHRRLPDDPALADAVRAMLRQLRAGGRLRLLSPLADGADLLAAELALAEGDALHVVLPMPAAAYRADFSDAAWARAQALLDRAERLTVTEGRGDGAYARCGRRVAEQAEVMLAIWDGAPSLGPGGTAEIVSYACRLGRPVWWISAAAPYEVVLLPSGV